MTDTIKIGTEYSVPYPFVLEDYNGFDDGGPFTRKSWRPGVRNEFVPPDNSEAVADGMGRMVLYIVGTYKPGKYPERVFFTRTWQTPANAYFGKTKLHIATVQKFRRLIGGFYHEFRVVEKSSQAA